MESNDLLSIWRERIADYRGSGLTLARWCEDRGYSIGQAKYWITRINRLARKSDSSNVSDRETRKWAQVSVIEPDGNDTGISISVGVVRIDVRNGFDKSALADVIRVAKAC